MALFGGQNFDILSRMGIDDSQYNSKIIQAKASSKGLAESVDKVMNVALIAGAVAFAASTAAAIQFQSSFTGVTKTVDGLRDPMGNLNEDGIALAQSFRNLALEVPISVNELNKIGELGGQLGIAREDLISFTETVAMLGVTTNLTTEAAAVSMARFVNVTRQVAPEGLSASQQVARLGATVVELGNNFATTEAEIVEMSMRLAGVGATIGLTQAEIMGFSAALSSVGISAERGGTAFSRIMVEMAATSGEQLELFAETANLTVSEFETLFKEDASEALIAFIGGLNRTKEAGGDTFGILEDLGFSNVRVRETLLLASSATELFSDALDTASYAYIANNALTQEAAQRFATVESQLQLVKNIIYDTGIEIGNNFLPAISGMLSIFTEHPEAIKSVVTTLAELSIMFGTAAIAVKSYQLIMNAVKAAQLLWAASFGPVGIAIAALAAGIVIIKNVIDHYNVSTEDHIRLLGEAQTEYNKQKTAIDEGTGSAALYDQALINLKTAQTNLGGTIEDTTQALIDQTNQIRDTQINTLREQLAGLEIAYEGAKGQIISFNDETGSTVRDEILEDLANQIRNTSEELDRLGPTSKEAAIQAQFLADIELIQKQQLEELNPEIIKHSDAIESVGSAANNSYMWMADLSDQTIAMKQPTHDLTLELVGEATAIEYTAEQMKAMNIETAIAKGLFIDAKPPVKDLNDEAEYSNTIFDILGATIATYGFQLLDSASSLGIFGDANSRSSQTVNLLGGALTTVLQGGFDPISLGISVVTGLLGIFSSENEVVVRSLEDVQDSLGGVYDEIERLNDVAGSLSFESNWIISIQSSIDAYLEILTTATGSTRTLYENLVADLQEQYTNLLAYFTFDEAVVTALGNLDYFVEETNRILSYYGEGFEGQEGFAQLLYEQIIAAQRLIGTLDPSSQAFRELSEQLQGARQALSDIGSPELMAYTGANLVALMLQAEEGSATWLAYKDELILVYRAMYEAGNLLDTAVTFAFETFGITLDEIIGTTEEVVTVTESQLIPVYENLATTVSERVIPTLIGMGDQVDIVTGKIDGVPDFDFLMSISNFQEFQDAMEGGTAVIAELVNFGVDLDTTQADENLLRLINRMNTYLGTLAPGSPGYEEARASIRELVQAYIQMGGSIPNELLEQLREALTLVNPLLVETGEDTEAIADNFNRIQARVNDTTTGFINILDPLSNVNDGMGDLEGNFRGLNTQIASLVINWGTMLGTMFDTYDQFELDMITASNAIQELLYFNIDLDTTTVDEQILAAIGRMGNFLQTLDPNSEAYRDARDSLNDLIAQFIAMGGDITALQRLLRILDGTTVTIDILRNYNEMEFMHTGGIATAHTGLLNYGEVPTILRDNEVVISPLTSEKYTEPSWLKFNATGDVQDLQSKRKETQSSQSQMQQVEPLIINMYNQSEDSRVELYDQSYSPREVEIRRKYTGQGDPYV